MSDAHGWDALQPFRLALPTPGDEYALFRPLQGIKNLAMNTV